MNYRKTYKKRKAFHITIIAISVIAGLYFNMMLPGVVRDNVPCVDVIFPERTEYIPSVTCSGTVGYSQVRSIKEEIPLIIKEYLVNVGDRVDQGQTIAVVDKQAVCDNENSGTGIYYFKYGMRILDDTSAYLRRYRIKPDEQGTETFNRHKRLCSVVLQLCRRYPSALRKGRGLLQARYKLRLQPQHEQRLQSQHEQRL